ncbi:MAG: LysM peptidoglycan-binding domain-containing protein [Clostridia bacterium]
MKIKNVKKFIRSIFIILGVIFILSLIVVKSTLSYTNHEYKTIYVKSGDTLWSIASDLQENDSYYKGKDIRYIIGDLKEINKLSNSMVYANQKLQIPIV